MMSHPNKKPEKKIDSMLSDQTKQINHSKGFLTFLFRKILHDQNITVNTWNRLLSQYINRPINGKPREGKARSTEQNNLCKEIVRSNMTWAVFLKGIRILNPIAIRLSVEIQWRAGPPTMHSVKIPIIDLDRAVDKGNSNEQ